MKRWFLFFLTLLVFFETLALRVWTMNLFTKGSHSAAFYYGRAKTVDAEEEKYRALAKKQEKLYESKAMQAHKLSGLSFLAGILSVFLLRREERRYRENRKIGKTERPGMKARG